MCGIVGVASNAPVNQLIYDALLLLQHRGQDAAGIVTQLDRKFHMHKAKGMVKDVFRTRNMRSLPGNCGLGQVRYPTAGNAFSEEEAQPFYVNAPFGLVLVHNGNLTNAKALKAELFSTDHRHINTESDSEVLLNVLAHELEKTTRGLPLTPADVFKAVQGVHRRVKGSYAVIALIAGHGLLAFRDPFGIRPLCIGKGKDGTYMLASESVALEGTLHQFERNVEPGEAVFIDMQTQIHSQQCADHPQLNPCIFEYVYLARPDSTLDGISVYQARLNLGETLAKRVISTVPPSDIDVVIPIPESSRPSAAQLAQLLGLPYREGFVKNRYVGRTFIMPGQAVRKKSVRQNSTSFPASSRAAMCCWWTTLLCEAPQAVKLCKWPERRVRARSTWPAPPRRYVIPMCTALTCRPKMNWWRTTDRWMRFVKSSTATPSFTKMLTP
jgi:amidophosphoribosyltransferase